MRIPLAWTTALTALLLAAPARGQDPERLLDDASALCVKGENLPCLAMLERIPEAAAAPVLIRKHTTIVEVLATLDRLAEIPAHIARARTLAERSGDPAGMARVATAEGLLQRITQRGDRGLAAYHRAAGLAATAGDSRLLSRIHQQLADAYHLVEDWERFTYHTETAFRLLPNPSLTARFNHAIRIGISRFQAYDRDASEEQFTRALALAVESSSLVNQSFAEGQLAYVYWTFDRDAPRALEHYTRAIDMALGARAPGVEAAWRVHRGNVRRETGEYGAALTDFQRALTLWEASASGDRFAATKHIGHTYRLLDRLDEARAVLEPLVASRPFNPTPRHLWAAQLELASTYEALGDRPRAADQYRAMIEVLEEHRNTSILDSFRSGSFAHSLSAYDPYERYMRFLIAGGDAVEALRVSELARARSFLEMLASVRSAVAARVPAPLLEEEARIAEGISTVQRELRAADLPKAEREARLARLAALEGEREAFLVRLRIEQPALAEARYPEVLEPAALQPMLRPAETAIVFFLGEPESFRWTVTRDAIVVARIPGRATIEERATRLRALLRAPGDVVEARAEAGRLSALLLDGVPAGDSPLLVVPHGVLHYIPFEMLPQNGRLLIERRAIGYAPSLNAAAYLRRRPVSGSPFRVLAVGAPAVEPQGGAQDAARAGDVDTIAMLGPLPFAGEEIGAIRRMFGHRADALSGAEARESALRGAALERYPVVHFATHGLVNEVRPGRSGLLFSPEPGEDGILQTPEIYRLGMRADLVVLSACQTALGREVTGEGLVGLTRAFFYSGARSVLAALWNLNDRFAADFVERFYAEVRRGHTSEEALRRTKLAFVDHPQFGHPFYWSSLVLAGDGTIVLYRESRMTMLAPVGALLVLVAVLGIVVRGASRRSPSPR